MEGNVPTKLDTVIIGGGQAGLAMSYHLRQRGREHVILERHRIAERWRTERWDSLRFQLPNSWLALPGKRFEEADPDGFTHYPNVIRFIEQYAQEIAAPVRTGIEVTRLSQNNESRGYVLDTSGGEFHARQVVIATGPFQRPLIPDYSIALPSGILQIEAAHYRNPSELPPGAVLVVGSGNSGCQIADELLQSGRRVFLSVSRHSRVPRRYRGRDVIWWYEELGRFDVNVDNFPGRRYPPTSIMTGINGGYDLDPRRLGNAGASLVGRVSGARDGELLLATDTPELLAAADRICENFIKDADAFAAGPALREALDAKEDLPPLASPHVEDRRTLNLRDENITAIIWANGYGFSFGWVELPVLNELGVPIQTRGVTPCRGIYFLGLHWMHTFRSAILPFVGRDASYLADHIEQLAAGVH
jgi:putative flavoprotein involved in K+ transport